MTTEERYRAILGNHLPADAVDWVYGYLNRYKVHFHITRGRRSKLGDYRWPQGDHNFHEISINGDLNPYMFLWVLLHEAAHLETHLKYKRVSAHGHEWQGEYAALLRENIHFFPVEVRQFIELYSSRIPLARAVGRHVEELLRRHDAGYDASAVLSLDDLPAGSLFRLKAKPEHLFRSQEKRRTRWLCIDIATHRQYTVSGSAEVEKVVE